MPQHWSLLLLFASEKQNVEDSFCTCTNNSHTTVCCVSCVTLIVLLAVDLDELTCVPEEDVAPSLGADTVGGRVSGRAADRPIKDWTLH